MLLLLGVADVVVGKVLVVNGFQVFRGNLFFNELKTQRRAADLLFLMRYLILLVLDERVFDLDFFFQVLVVFGQNA